MLAAAAPAALPQEAVDLASVTASLPLVRQVSLLEDESARLEADAAAASSGWRAATPAQLAHGFSGSALWFKGEVYNGSDRPATRWLAVGSSRLEDVRYYDATQADAARWKEQYRAGVDTPVETHPVNATLSVFPITLQPGEHRRFMVRIESRTSITVDLTLWKPESYLIAEHSTAMWQLCLTGSMLTLAALAAVLGAVWHDRVFALLTASIVAEAAYEFTYEGYLYLVLLHNGGDLVVRLTSILGNLTVALFTATVMVFLRLDRITPWKWIYRVLIAATLCGAVWTALGDYRVSAKITLYAVFLTNAAWAVSMLDGWRRKLPNAQLILLAFAPDIVTLFLRLAVSLGLLADTWSPGSAHGWDTLSVLLLMLLISVGRLRQVYGAQREAKQELAAARAREREELERAVDARTRELRDALIAADDANRARGNFLARVSHDLRTPLTAIIGFADLIRASGRDETQYGHVIRRNADHMLSMVNDLIDYAGGNHPETLHPKPIYVHALLDAVRQNGTALAANNHNTFRIDIDGELPPVLELDGKRVEQILGNLIDNAAKFTERGTIRLKVSCRKTKADDHLYELTLSVSDTGVGIDHEDQERIFEPFIRIGESHRPGIGLGLAIVKQWIVRMDGTVSVDSAPGRGTTFRIGLRVRAVDEDEVGQVQFSEPAYTLPAIDGGGRRVLIAEDSAEIRQLLRDDLKSQGFEVETAADGLAAIARLKDAGAPPLDLVLTDHLMPGANGLDILAAARRHHPGLPVIALSATPQQAEDGTPVSVALRYDASLLKPVSLVDLRNAIARRLGLLPGQPAAAAPPHEGPVVRPARAVIAEALPLIELGAVSDLIDWAARIAGDDSRYKPFAEAVVQLARQGELSRLRALLLERLTE